ncbi:hypothetical protein EGT49_04970 [Companilactobacillus suantsaicola]|uniref:Uncharacterized protein n=1 Tax=Companilactobacillus suantsaicola TaxID=2487723 RepID=A0A4Z0JN18_9LACO|nr:hypothetical protein EGT49_04970 [Companilactobacillus suantsaicola]
MLSREISLNALAFSERPILETIPAFGIGFKLRPPRSSVSQSCCGRRHLTHKQTKNEFLIIDNFYIRG